MFKQIGLILSVLSLGSAAQAAGVCGSHLRVIHGNAFDSKEIQVQVQGKRLGTPLKFGEFSDYISIPSGAKTLEIVDASTGTVLAQKPLHMGENLAYSVVYAGPAKGPEGMLFGNESPFVILDDLSPVSNPGRWKGHWYRMSETNVVIDFRVQSETENLSAKLFAKPNRSVYQLGDFPAGTYRFNPLLMGSEDPLFNTALNPPAFVELKNVEVPGGVNYDILAVGNFLGQGPNSLRLLGHMTRTELRSGCLVVSTVARTFQD